MVVPHVADATPGVVRCRFTVAAAKIAHHSRQKRRFRRCRGGPKFHPPRGLIQASFFEVPKTTNWERSLQLLHPRNTLVALIIALASQLVELELVLL